MVKQPSASQSSTYRTRLSQGITPKKRQSFGEFVELPKVKRRATAAAIAAETPIQPQVEEESSDEESCSATESKCTATTAKDEQIYLNTSSLTMKKCFVKLERLSESRAVSSSDVVPIMLFHRKQDDTVVNKLLRKCSIEGCINNTDDINKEIDAEFFEIPSNRKLRSLWLKVMQKKWTSNLCVCSRHFTADQLITSPDVEKQVLAEGAVPKKDLPSLKRKSDKSSETIESTIVDLHNEKCIDGDCFRVLQPFLDLKYETINGGEGTEDYDRVHLFAKTIFIHSEKSYELLKKIIRLPDVDIELVYDCLPVHRKGIQRLFPGARCVYSSLDLTQLIIDHGDVLKGVKYLVEDAGDFPMSDILVYVEKDQVELKNKVYEFSKIIFLNNPNFYKKLLTCLPFPRIEFLFETLNDDDDGRQFITLGDLLKEALRTIDIGDDAINSIKPFLGRHMCPFNNTTVSLNSHIISTIFFNALGFFNFLTQYLPLPNIVLFPKSDLNKDGVSPASKTVGARTKRASKINSSSPPCKISADEAVLEEKTQAEAAPDAPEATAINNTTEEFVRGICPKTGRNVAKMEIDTGGFLPKDLNVRVVGHLLTITGSRVDNGKESAFFKSITLPNYVDADEAGCFYLKGKMSVHAPILEEKNDGTVSGENVSSESSGVSICSGGEQTNNSTPSSVSSLPSKDVAGNQTVQTSPEPANLLSTNKKKPQQLKSHQTSPNEDGEMQRNFPVMVNVDGEEHLNMVVEVSTLFKPSEIVVKVRDNKVLSISGEARSSDAHSKSRLYAFIEREFDLPKKIDRTTLKAGVTSDGLLKIFGKVMSDENGH